MINSDPYAERTVCSCLVSNPYMNNWNAAQGICIYFIYLFFFCYFFSLRHCLCLYLGPVHSFGGDQYVMLPGSQKLLPLISTLQTVSLLVPSPFTDSSLCRQGELVPLSTMKKRKSLDILPIGEGKSTPYIKPGILPALFRYEKVMHIHKLEKSVPCEEMILHNSKSRELQEWLLCSLPTQGACLCCVP